MPPSQCFTMATTVQTLFNRGRCNWFRNSAGKIQTRAPKSDIPTFFEIWKVNFISDISASCRGPPSWSLTVLSSKQCYQWKDVTTKIQLKYIPTLQAEIFQVHRGHLGGVGLLATTVQTFFIQLMQQCCQKTTNKSGISIKQLPINSCWQVYQLGQFLKYFYSMLDAPKL